MDPSFSPEAFQKNLQHALSLYQQAMQQTILKQSSMSNNSVVDPFRIGQLWGEMAFKLWSEPNKIWHHQQSFSQKYYDLMQHTLQRLRGEDTSPIYAPAAKDKRFKDNAWKDNVVFDFIKQYYLMISEWTEAVVKDIPHEDDATERKMMFFTRQALDALAPTNFIFTNPEILKATLSTNGENLAKGMENFLRDMEQSKGLLTITTTDTKAFEVGKNIATTAGKVVYQNEMMQLIHYEPTTKEQWSRPILITPPWINKYYILDLREENSFVRWLLDQGYSVFIISWVNPTTAMAEKNFENYMLEGPLAALDFIEKQYGVKEVSAVGYCIGGTLLSTTLAYMQAKKDERIKTATFLSTLIDFSSVGDLAVFIGEEQLQALEQYMEKQGYFDNVEMTLAFNMLRANEMIWSFVINNYLLGKDPFPFDLLYWNADATRLPAAMHSFYLRNMYQHNRLAKGELVLNGTPINMQSINIPCYFIATQDDHIVPWQGSYQGTQIVKGPATFVLGGSGHVAGIINHPRYRKYGYYANAHAAATAEEWYSKAEQHDGSWWEHWNVWQQGFLTQKMDALSFYSKTPALEDAPGNYVKVRY